MEKENIFYHIALTLIPGIGPVSARSLISYCGTAEKVFKSKRSALMKIPGVGEFIADAILHHEVFGRAEEELEFIEKKGIIALAINDLKYPARLKNCIDCPVLLYYIGDADLNADRILGIVGTRNATDYGRALTEELIEGIMDENILVVSGLAYGIDVIAHRACVKRHIPTIGVVGHGLDTIYPFAHRETAKKMVQHGGILTEFMSKTKPDKQNFPKRNRIVAGMIDALVVVETAVDGGALITAMYADGYNKDVVGYPGNTNNKYSQGCNFLIKTNRAALVENSNDVLEFLSWKKTEVKPMLQRSLFVELDPEDKLIYDVIVTNIEIGIDELTSQVKLTPSMIAGCLLNLEFQGLIASLPGKRYKLN